jgi:hypothetical protein
LSVPYHSHELVEVVAELARQVAALTVEVRQSKRITDRKSVSPDAAELVRAVHAAMADAAFTALELQARSLEADAPGLCLAALLAGRSPRSVGHMLAKAADKDTGGLVLRRVGEDRAGCVWCVVRV